MELKDLDLTKSYTYADYLTWDFPERVELINGKVFVMDFTEPDRDYNAYSLKMSNYLKNYFRSINCKVFVSPFDIPANTEQFDTYLPDINIISSSSTQNGSQTPDIIIYISSSNKTHLKERFEVYQRDGIKEFWVISPYHEYISVYKLTDGIYLTGRPIVSDDIVTSTLIPELSLNSAELFEP